MALTSNAKPDPFWIERIAAGQPPRLRNPGESVEDYRVAMGWDKPPPALKPCPFCGGSAGIDLHDGDANTWIARCTNSDCTTWPSTDCLQYDDAVDAWNRRADAAGVGGSDGN